MGEEALRKRLFFSVVVCMALIGCNAHMMSTIDSSRDPFPDVDESEDVEVDENYPTYIVINIPSRELRLFHHMREIYKFPVAVGAPYFKTPVGPRMLNQIVWNPWWIPPDSEWAKNDQRTPPGPGNPLGVVKMDLGRAILLHGTNKEYTVGQPASHGCMRMLNEDARTLAWWIQNHFTDQTEGSLLETYKSHPAWSYYVTLPQPLPVKIEYELFQIEKDMFRAHPDIYISAKNRLAAAYHFLEGRGYVKERISRYELERVMRLSGKTSFRVALRELMPGKFVAARDWIDDPVHLKWETRGRNGYKGDRRFSESRTSSSVMTLNRDFTSLFSTHSI